MRFRRCSNGRVAVPCKGLPISFVKGVKRPAIRNMRVDSERRRRAPRDGVLNAAVVRQGERAASPASHKGTRGGGGEVDSGIVLVEEASAASR